MPDLVTIKRLPVMKAGTHTDSTGEKRVITVKDLDGMIANFSADQAGNYRPPVVLGHPKMDDPRYGDFLGLARDGDTLFADVGVIPELNAQLKKGQYPDRSLRLQRMDNGTMRIKHLGLLGVIPPGVKGLPAYQFSGEDGMTIDFSEASAINTVGGIFQRLRDWMIEKFGQDTADRVLLPAEIDELKNCEPDDETGDGMDDAGELTDTSFAQGDGKKKKPPKYASVPDDEFLDAKSWKYPIDEAHIQAALSYWAKPENRQAYSPEEQKAMTDKLLAAAKKQGIAVDKGKWNFSEKEEDMGEIEELRRQIAEKDGQISEFSEGAKTKDARIRELEADGRKRGFAEFCEGLSREGKLPPAYMPTAIDFMEILSGAEEFEFSEGEGKSKKAPVEAFKTFLSGMGKVIEFSETATKDRATGTSVNVTSAQDVAAKALEFQEAESRAGRTISISDAVTHITKGGK